MKACNLTHILKYSEGPDLELDGHSDPKETMLSAATSIASDRSGQQNVGMLAWDTV